MFREKDRYLSLAVATRPDIALARMNKTDSFDEEFAEAEAL
jgi:hypothetical protein